jgi:poly(3-hydroxybutyrate) depolymerase
MYRNLVGLAAFAGMAFAWACSAPPDGGVTKVPGSGSGTMGSGGQGGTGAPSTGGSMQPVTGGVGGEVGSGGIAGTAAGGTAPAAGGSAGTGTGGGGPADINSVDPSSGCGKALPEGQTLGSYKEYTVHVTGATLTAFNHPAHDRAYHVHLPNDYDMNKAYRTVYIGYGCGNKYAGATATYPLFNAYPEAIYVGMNMPPTGIAQSEGDCYNDDGGANSTEWEFFALMANEVQANFCSDRNRNYVAGYSSGSWVANMHSCYFAGYDPARKFGPNISVRGTTVVTGGLPAIPACGGKVAGMWIHDAGDSANVIGGNIAALNRVLAVNGCTGSPQADWGEGIMAEAGCKQYTACPAEYPVVFCTTSNQGHDAQNQHALPGFTQFLSMMDPI